MSDIEYDVISTFDEKKTPIGTLLVSNDRVVSFWDTDDGFNTMFGEAIGESFAATRQRYRNFAFVAQGKSTKEGADVAKMAEGEISKIDPEKQLVFGWAYVAINKAGEVVHDKSGDFVDDVSEVEAAAYDYVLSSRQGDADHTNVKGAEMVESIVFTPEKIEKMGIPEGVVPLGWWIGFKVQDPATWERVKKGELRAFSIHGSGKRTPVL